MALKVGGILHRCCCSCSLWVFSFWKSEAVYQGLSFLPFEVTVGCSAVLSPLWPFDVGAKWSGMDPGGEGRGGGSMGSKSLKCCSGVCMFKYVRSKYMIPSTSTYAYVRM